MHGDRKDPAMRISQRLIEAIREVIQSLMADLAKGAFHPAGLVHFFRAMGMDLSQLSGTIGQQRGFDPYTVLGLDRLASDEEVRHRYRKLLRKLHPDTSGVEGTSFLLQMVLAAYEMIKRERGWKQ